MPYFMQNHCLGTTFYDDNDFCELEWHNGRPLRIKETKIFIESNKLGFQHLESKLDNELLSSLI